MMLSETPTACHMPSLLQTVVLRRTYLLSWLGVIKLPPDNEVVYEMKIKSDVES